MRSLAIFALLWLAVHLGVSGTRVRNSFAERLGERAFRGAFAFAALVLIVALSRAYATAPSLRLWFTPGWLRWVLVAAMLPASVLLVLSFRRNPTAAGGEALLGQEPHGIQRVTRHPDQRRNCHLGGCAYHRQRGRGLGGVFRHLPDHRGARHAFARPQAGGPQPGQLGDAVGEHLHPAVRR